MYFNMNRSAPSIKIPKIAAGKNGNPNDIILFKIEKSMDFTISYNTYLKFYTCFLETSDKILYFSKTDFFSDFDIIYFVSLIIDNT